MKHLLNTVEMFCKLDKDREKVFKRKSDGLEIKILPRTYSNDNLPNCCYYWSSGHPYLSPDDEWEEVPQEVTWQEAIEAWVNGSCVKSVLNQEEHVYNESQGFVSDQNYSLQDNSDVLATWSFHTLTKEEILYAKWYIL